MTKQQRRAIDREFYSYERNKRQAAEYVASHAFDNFSLDFGAPRVRTSQKNTAERRVIDEIDGAERKWRWCKVFELTFNKFRWDKKDELMTKKYIEQKPPLQVARELHVDRATYFRWLDEVRATALQWAQELGLL